MAWRLSDGVRVRRESWGLLFYRPAAPKLCFVKSGDWLRPDHFNGAWLYESIVEDITRRTGAPRTSVEHLLPRLTDRLTKNGVISHEVR